MADDPPKKEMPAESLLPPAPSTTRGAIRYTNTISRKQFAQLSGAEPPQLCAVALIGNFIRTLPTFIRTCTDECGNPIP